MKTFISLNVFLFLALLVTPFARATLSNPETCIQRMNNPWQLESADTLRMRNILFSEEASPDLSEGSPVPGTDGSVRFGIYTTRWPKAPTSPVEKKEVIASFFGHVVKGEPVGLVRGFKFQSSNERFSAQNEELFPPSNSDSTQEFEIRRQMNVTIGSWMREVDGASLFVAPAETGNTTGWFLMLPNVDDAAVVRVVALWRPSATMRIAPPNRGSTGGVVRIPRPPGGRRGNGGYRALDNPSSSGGSDTSLGDQ